MERYLIELDHDATEDACKLAMETIHETGSHFLTNAEWGCKDGEHKCWIIVEVENKDQARLILPPIYRNDAKVIRLIRYTPDKIEEAIENKEY